MRGVDVGEILGHDNSIHAFSSFNLINAGKIKNISVSGTLATAPGVPEPSTLGVLALGLLMRQRRRTKID